MSKRRGHVLAAFMLARTSSTKVCSWLKKKTESFVQTELQAFVSISFGSKFFLDTHPHPRLIKPSDKTTITEVD